MRPSMIGRAGVLLLLLPLALSGWVAAQGAPADAPRWVVDANADTFNTQGGVGFAYVEAFSYPAHMEQIDTGLFLACDPSAEDGFELYLWTQEASLPAISATGTLNVLSRRGQDAVRSNPWRVIDFGDGYQEVVADAAARRLLLEDLRRGGVLALRLESDPSRGVAQPTFEFLVDGFAQVEATLSVCAAQRAASAARDPFADAAPRDPFAAPPADPFAAPPADPFAAPATDPFAAPPANPLAPPAADPFTTPPASDPFAPTTPADPFAAPAGDDAGDLLIDPVTGLINLQSQLSDYPSLPVQPVDHLLSDTGLAALVGPQDARGRFNAIGAVCQPGAGDNGVYVELMSTWMVEDQTVLAVLYHAGREVGGLDVQTTLDNEGSPTGYLVWDEDEVGFAIAVELYDRLDVLLFVEGAAEPSDHWQLDAAGLRPALAGLACRPR